MCALPAFCDDCSGELAMFSFTIAQSSGPAIHVPLVLTQSHAARTWPHNLLSRKRYTSVVRVQAGELWSVRPRNLSRGQNLPTSVHACARSQVCRSLLAASCGVEVWDSVNFGALVCADGGTRWGSILVP